jgi:stringent starvation protein B
MLTLIAGQVRFLGYETKNMGDNNMEKKNLCRALLLEERSVFVHVRGNHPKVVLPAKFKNSDHVVLQWGYELPVHIPDLKVTNKSLSGTLTFGGIPFHVDIPWEAVYAFVTEAGMGRVFEEDVPESLKTPQKKKPSPQLKLVSSQKNLVQSNKQKPKLSLVR